MMSDDNNHTALPPVHYRRRRVGSPVDRLRFLKRRWERLTMRKIERVNTNPAYCWPQLVGWQFTATHDRPARIERLPISIVDCKAEAACVGVCYCGKFASTIFLGEYSDFTSIPMEVLL